MFASRKHLAPLCAAVFAACAISPAPGGWLPTPSGTQADAHGGWIEVQLQTPGVIARGELVALGEDTAYILTDHGLATIPFAHAQRAELWSFGSEAGILAGWAFLGTLSTVSNGFFLMLTAPMWMIGGTVSTAVRSREPRIIVQDRASWSQLRPFARFPQGLPPGLDRASLRPRG